MDVGVDIGVGGDIGVVGCGYRDGWGVGRVVGCGYRGGWVWI
jgi:hypothetical protein